MSACALWQSGEETTAPPISVHGSGAQWPRGQQEGRQGGGHRHAVRAKLRGWAMGTAGFTGGCPAVKYWPCTRDGRILVFPTAHKTEPEEAVLQIQLGFVFTAPTLGHTVLYLAHQPSAIRKCENASLRVFLFYPPSLDILAAILPLKIRQSHVKETQVPRYLQK